MVLSYSSLGALDKSGSVGMCPQAAMDRKVSSELQCHCAVHRVDSPFNFFTGKIAYGVFKRLF